MLKINKALIEKNKALIGRKLDQHNDHWYWNGATVYEVHIWVGTLQKLKLQTEYGMNYLLLEKNSKTTWTSEPVVEVLE